MDRACSERVAVFSSHQRMPYTSQGSTGHMQDCHRRHRSQMADVAASDWPVDRRFRQVSVSGT